MKKKYEKMLWQIRDDMKKVPLAISGTGAQSACITSFVSTCRDLQVEHENVVCFLDYLQQLMFWEEHIKKVDEWEKEEIQETIDYTKEQMYHFFNEYHSWVEERCNAKWS